MSIQNEPQPSYSRWLTEEVFKLIEMVRSDEAIYNPRHKYYFCRPYVENFWREVDLRLRKNPGASLAKWTNLRISFRREYTNYQDEKVPPCWSYFDKMFFLHPYLRNKKLSGPKDVDPHLHDALTQITNANYRPHQSTNVSPVNDYMDQYLSYCEDEPHSSPGMVELIEEDEENEANSSVRSVRNEIKSECENDDRDISRDHEEYKDIIVEISDDTQPNAAESGIKRESSHLECGNRSLLKRCRTDQAGSSSAITPSSNISFVRPLTIPQSSNEINLLHNSIPSSSHAGSSNRMATGPSSPARRNDFCECKTDSDAMFLMSLLPDIRKLNGRDRGKIKIAFQNTLQEFLYPD